MDIIYIKAEKRFIFLGPASESSDRAMGAFNAIGERAIKERVFDFKTWQMTRHLCIKITLYFSQRKGKRRYTDAFYQEQRKMIDPTYESGNPIILIAEISVIMNRPWWTRVWVLQELLLS